MKERPILMSGSMVRATLEDRKTHTRRIIKQMPSGRFLGIVRKIYYWFSTPDKQFSSIDIKCPYGVPGDRLWVRESFSYDFFFHPGHMKHRFWYWADGNPEKGDWGKPKPSIHMPRAASRITLEIKDIRVERLQNITEDDALAEGVVGRQADVWLDPYEVYAELWDSINGPGAWNKNPWVWVVVFERVKP